MSEKILVATICLIIGIALGQLISVDPGEPEPIMTAHEHPLIEVADPANAPEVEIEAIPDRMGGYNIQITTENFTFTPELANEPNQENAGHAHIYVNGEKTSRVYSDWFYLGAELFPLTKNEVRVTLNTNDHGEWALDGNAIADELMLAPVPKPDQEEMGNVHNMMDM